MLQTTGGRPRHPAWQFLKTALFSCAIVCMAMVAAMNWNCIILLIPEHQLCRLRHQQGEMRVTRTPPPAPSLWFIYSIEAKGQIMIPAHLLSSYPPLSGGMKQVQQCFEHITTFKINSVFRLYYYYIILYINYQQWFIVFESCARSASIFKHSDHCEAPAAHITKENTYFTFAFQGQCYLQ